MINVQQVDDTYRITFRYDPMVISMVKAVPGRRWVPEGKYWEIPKDKLGFFINQTTGTDYEGSLRIQSDEHLYENTTLDTTATIPDIDISSIPYYVKEGATPYKHQLDFMKFALNRQNAGNMSGFLLADEQGLAKTNEIMNLAIYNRKQYKFKHCLVICCINSSKYNWLRDIQEHSKDAEKPYILGSRRMRNGKIRYEGSSEEKFVDLDKWCMYGTKGEKLPYFLIVNIEALRYRQGRVYPIANKIIERIQSGDIQMIAIDEIHKNASMTSKQGKQILRIKKQTGSSVMWLPMTGTPITNKPTDVFLPLKLVDGHGYDTYTSWCNNFCVTGGFGGYEIIGYKNIPTLKRYLQFNMIRRLKADVLDLPPKIQCVEYVENTSYQNTLYARVKGELMDRRDEIQMSLNPLAELLKLRQVNGSPELVDPDLDVEDNYKGHNAKFARLMELLEEIHERGEKVLVFSNWVEPLRTLYKFISQHYKTCCFTGTMKPEEREHHKEVFQNNPDYTVMLGTIGAAGTTHTFTAASNIIFYDEPWTPSDKAQAEDRIYRIGTRSAVNIYTLISADTVDDRIHDILYTKRSVSQYIVDNKLDVRNNPKLLNMLLD